VFLEVTNKFTLKLIDDIKGVTLAAASSKIKEIAGAKVKN
jgi:hypothetical protein